MVCAVAYLVFDLVSKNQETLFRAKLTGETSSSLVLPNVNASHHGMYTSIVSDVAGCDSNSVVVSSALDFPLQAKHTDGTNVSEVVLMCEAEAFPNLQ